jgi:bifunctional DNA-binding transcriptional regulator/antitoxin component of YhaV-PrlF toxin-antitoxin module
MTVPPDLREALSVKPGDKLKFTPLPDGGFRVEKAVGLDALRGIIKLKEPVDWEEIDRLIAERRGR